MNPSGNLARRLPFILLAAALGAQTPAPIELAVDASDAARKVFHARLSLAATPGRLRLAYPKWIPGEHGPTGPIADLVNLRITAAGRAIAWRRDPADMYVVVVDVPAGVSRLDLAYDFLPPGESQGFSSGASTTPELGVVSWNQLLLFPQGRPSDQLEFRASLKVPSGWRYGTALPIARETGDQIEFRPASLTTLVDSPVLTGRYFRTLDLSPGANPPHYLHLAADSAAALAVSPQLVANYRRLAAETGALFGARHYRGYHFLLTLSDHVAHFGLEHHESSDNRIPEWGLTDDDLRPVHAGLLPHEMTHSWNGKYRRPAGLATGGFEKPMEGELLWVYEGLTTYLGNVLTARSGLCTAEQYRQFLAMDAAALDAAPGRQWRPLADTAVAAQILYAARGGGRAARRSVDFYPEGDLIWLEADVTIRRLSQGRRSLDDFCRRFFGGASGPPEVKTYTVDSLLADLNAVQPFDWRGFFDQRVYRVNPRAPLGGIQQSGWKLVYRTERSAMQKASEDAHKGVDVRHSLGLTLDQDAVISDVLPGSPADRAGLSPGGKLLAVNGRQFTAKWLRQCIRDAKDGTAPIELLVKDGETYKVHRAGCHTGERYPDLERDESQTDLLTAIIAGKTP